MKPFYITTTLPYVNADPHVGFAMEIIRADVIARYKRLQGYEVFFNTGTDEHGQKLLADATKAGKEVKEYVDHYAEQFRGLKQLLSISNEVHFIRTTDTHHEKAAQELWRRVAKNGYIYKKNYEAKYCVGCELEKTDSELNEQGRCPIHPDRELEIINEENYFFALSKAASLLKKLYEEKPNLVIPDFRFNEIRAFLERGLEDFSISRLKSKMSWGVPVPGDDDHVMYVWFDALTNYISTLGWPRHAEASGEGGPEDLFTKFWVTGEKVQYCGKDNVRQQSMMWQAMLLAAGLPTTDHIVINGFINSGGQKMSKSLGNVISPNDIIKLLTPVAGELATDVLRYYLLRHVNSFEDSDMTIETVKEAYQANLANGLGNLVSRIMTLSEKYCDPHPGEGGSNLPAEIKKTISTFDIQKAMNTIWNAIGELDGIIAATKPFSVVKEDEAEGKRMISSLVDNLFSIVHVLEPFMPNTAEQILALIKENKKPETSLFARLS
ncbi:MAG TPA: methionine--tRNA ligase [Candidatus Paceibacterota bacterium]|nr:methionine--tRNA ligase [Candidatus Paceibacterota bacterium]